MPRSQFAAERLAVGALILCPAARVWGVGTEGVGAVKSCSSVLRPPIGSVQRYTATPGPARRGRASEQGSTARQPHGTTSNHSWCHPV